MFTALHPLLLWGIAAVAVPVLIHLLLRRKPKPRPWAAMRWLLAAAEASRRRLRLTSLLLMALRCLAVLLLALAVVRPSLAGFGLPERLVLVVDASASMGARGSDPGPLATVRAALMATKPEAASAALVVVGERPALVAEGSVDEVLDALGRVEATALPGGIDRVVEGDALAKALGSSADVVLISDFQQDDGLRALAAVEGRCRHVTRWCVGKPTANALITGVMPIGDAPPGQPGEVALTVAGTIGGVAVAVDEGPFLAAPVSAVAGAPLRVVTPPLAAGAHRVRLRIDDQGLLYDNVAELPVLVRAAVPALVVPAGDRRDYLHAALAADTGLIAARTIGAGALATEALPDGGLIALRAVPADTARVAAWVQEGGVLWARWPLLHGDAHLRTVIEGLTVADATEKDGLVAGGAFACGEPDLDAILGTAARARVPRVQMPASATVALRAGTAPVVVVMRAGRGAVVVECDDVATDDGFIGRGTAPTWVVRTARRATALRQRADTWTAGMPVVQAVTLTRDGRALALAAGDVLMAAPGLWQSPTGPVVVLPNRDEARTDRQPPAGAVTTADAALPHRPGRDWGLPLIIAMVLLLLIEGAVAAWAGRRA